MTSTALRIKTPKPKVVAPAEDTSDSESENEVELGTEDLHLSDDEFPMSEDENGDSQEDENSDSQDDDENDGGSKWAATMAKLLKQKDDPTGKGLLLSKAKKTSDIAKIKVKPMYKFEVEGEVKEEKPDDLKIATELLKQKIMLKRDRYKTFHGLRQIPSIGDYERERTLKKIATRGTVQLFNAVRAQQKDIHHKLEAAGKLESKRDKVLQNINKKGFLDALMNGPGAKSEFVDNLVKDEDELKDEIKSESEDDDDESVPKSTWGALRADFLTGKKSGWDKEDEEDGERKVDNFDDSKMDSDSDSD